MKAMRIRHPASIESLYLDDVEPRAPGPGEMMVRIKANSLNFRDYIVATGFLPSKDGAIPLSDAAGEVVEIGEAVVDFSVGDAVMSTFHPAWADGDIERARIATPPGAVADGFACETVTRPAAHFTRAPRGLTHAESATLTCAGVTAWRALVTDGHIKPGARVLVLGTGGVSIFALQFAKAAGATVIATSSSIAKLEQLLKLGADHVVNYREQPDWGAAVLALTHGEGVDHVVEVGGPSTLPQSLTAVRTGGHVAIIGAVGGFDGAIPFAIVQAKRVRLQGVTVGSRKDQMEMVRAIDASGIKPAIAQSFALADLGAALRCQQVGGLVGKICIEHS